ADSFSFSMSVVLSTAGGGYSGAQRYFGLLGPVSLCMADFDGDGDLDVAIPTVLDSKVKVYPNSGYGTLGTPLSLSTTNQPQTPAIANYNGDGKPDIAVAGPGAMSVLINTSP
ncbi:MAG: FG-GAP repeat domain-containing protein, partial [Gammaproteobacteria bacterium]